MLEDTKLVRTPSISLPRRSCALFGCVITTNQNRKRIGKKKKNSSLCAIILLRILSFSFLYHFTSYPSSPQLQPRQHYRDNFLLHHIIVNIFPWNKICQNLFHLNPSPLFSYQLPKIYLPFQNEKSLMKPDEFDFRSLPTFLLYIYIYMCIYTPSTILSFLRTCL